MHCVLAVESEVGQVIKGKLQEIKPDWQFEICSGSWRLDEFSIKRPDVLVLSRFLPGESPEKLLKDLPVMFSASHIVLLVGELDEKCRGYLRVAQNCGLENYITGTLPGDRPYTLPVALEHSRKELGAEKLIDDKTVIAAPHIEDKAQDTSTLGQAREDSEPYNFVPEQSKQNPDPTPAYPAQPREKNMPREYAGKPVQQYPQQEFAQPDPGPEAYPQAQLGPVFRNENIPSSRWKAPRGQLISVVGNKGGVGKTTTTVTLANALAQAGVEVVIVDTDLASPNVADFFKLDVEHGIEFIAGRNRGMQIILDQVLMQAPKQENLYVLPGPVDKSTPVDTIFQKGELANILSVLLERFPVVIADSPANYRVCNWVPEVFQISDLALAVVDQSDFSEQDTARFAPELWIHGIHPQNIRVILNRFSPKLHNAKIVEKAFLSGFKKDIPKKQLPRVIATIPNDWDAYIKKGYKGETVGLDDARSQWHRVAEEIANMVGHTYEKPGKKKKGSKKNKGLAKGLFSRFKGGR